MTRRAGIVAALAALAIWAATARATCAPADVARTTLANGLRVVVIRDTLAPVVTAMLNYQVGSDEQWIPGLAHATEHMMFRGSATLSSPQLMDSVSVTGGDFDAQTQATVTRYVFTVPSADLDIALRAERSRATGLLVAPDQWNQERRAITQEVQQDNSNAFYRLFVRMQDRLIGGTPYAKNGLGTVADFAHTVNATQIRRFYERWYHPNNAVYVIAGDVDQKATIAQVRALFGGIPSARLPSRSAVRLGPLKAATYHDTSDQPFTVAALGYRFPGYDSPDYAAGQILGDVLSSERSTFGGLPFTGKALATEFVVQEYPKVGIALAAGVVPVTTPPETIDREMRALLEQYKSAGVPPDLVAAAKLREVSQLEFNANSIQGLGEEWSDAVAVQGLSSPDDMITRFENVTAADVNRVLRRYADDNSVVVAYAVPKNAGATSAGGPMAKEDVTVPPTTHQPLPSWAQHVLDRLGVPEQTLNPVDMRLSNGIRLIVQPENISHTVFVDGQIDNNPGMQVPPGKDGVDDVTEGLFDYGTTTYDRLAFAEQTDAIAANVSGGTDFGLDVLSSHFDRGMQLLADKELHPAFAPGDFAIVRDQTAGELVGAMTSPDHLADVALNKALYPPGDPDQRFATPASVRALTLDDVKAWYAAAYRPDLTTIVVIGDTTPQAARAAVEKYFGGWSATGPRPTTEPPPVPPNAPSATNVPATGRVQSSVRLEETLPIVRADPAWAQLQLANAVLTGGFYSSLLLHDLREIHGYAYSVGSRVGAGRVRATFNIDYACDAVNIVPAEAQVKAVLGRLQREPIEPERLLRSKALLIGGIPIRESSYDGVASQLIQYATLGLPLDQNLLDARAELGASAASVQAALARYVRPNSFVRIVTGPAPR